MRYADHLNIRARIFASLLRAVAEPMRGRAARGGVATRKRDEALHFARMTLAGASIAYNPYPRALRRDFAALRVLLVGAALMMVIWYAGVGLVIKGGI